MKIFWTDFAKSELHIIFIYYKEIAGIRITKKLITGIVKSTVKLSKYPQTGQVEELLVERPEGFRYLVYKNYKLIYWINSDMKRIEIVDVFDTRQNPDKIMRVGK